jgi:hypothetical protein
MCQRMRHCFAAAARDLAGKQASSMLSSLSAQTHAAACFESNKEPPCNPFATQKKSTGIRPPHGLQPEAAKQLLNTENAPESSLATVAASVVSSAVMIDLPCLTPQCH